MAGSFRDELVEIFANNPVAAIRSLPAYEQLSARFKDDFAFPAERETIERAKSRIEDDLDEEITQQESAKRAIRLLIKNRSDPAKRDLFHALLQAGYRKRWTPAQQQYFDLAVAKIKLKYDYFLSFTNRYKVAAGENPVNTMYEQFITSEISIDEYSKADRKAKNLLAEAINRLLAQPLNNGFYFPHRQNDNSVTEDKLKEACNNCLVFVQLVQPIMFERPQGRPNYCFFEWKLVRERFPREEWERHILFVAALLDRNGFEEINALVDIDYDDWYDHIQARDIVFLPEMSLIKNNEQILETKQLFQKQITSKIMGAWNRLLTGVPAV